MRFWAIKYNTCWVGRLHFPRQPGFGSKLVSPPLCDSRPARTLICSPTVSTLVGRMVWATDGWMWDVWVPGASPSDLVSAVCNGTGIEWSVINRCSVLIRRPGQPSPADPLKCDEQGIAKQSTSRVAVHRLFEFIRDLSQQSPGSSELVSMGESDETSDIYRLEIFLLVWICWEGKTTGDGGSNHLKTSDASRRLHHKLHSNKERIKWNETGKAGF